jgi:hypothetical protein
MVRRRGHPGAVGKWRGASLEALWHIIRGRQQLIRVEVRGSGSASATQTRTPLARLQRVGLVQPAGRGSSPVSCGRPGYNSSHNSTARLQQFAADEMDTSGIRSAEAQIRFQRTLNRKVPGSSLGADTRRHRGIASGSKCPHSRHHPVSKIRSVRSRLITGRAFPGSWLAPAVGRLRIAPEDQALRFGGQVRTERAVPVAPRQVQNSVP